MGVEGGPPDDISASVNSTFFGDHIRAISVYTEKSTDRHVQEDPVLQKAFHETIMGRLECLDQVLRDENK